MPYASDKQRRFFHANEDEIGKDVVREFDKTSKGKDLPEKKGAGPVAGTASCCGKPGCARQGVKKRAGVGY